MVQQKPAQLYPLRLDYFYLHRHGIHFPIKTFLLGYDVTEHEPKCNRKFSVTSINELTVDLWMFM